MLFSKTSELLLEGGGGGEFIGLQEFISLSCTHKSAHKYANTTRVYAHESQLITISSF